MVCETTPLNENIVGTVNWGDFGPLFYCFKSRELIIIIIIFSSECSHIDKEK